MKTCHCLLAAAVWLSVTSTIASGESYPTRAITLVVTAAPGGVTDILARVLAEHPELRGSKSLVMDLVLEEYSLRTAAGDQISKSDFCERFPAYRRSIAKLVATT